MSHNDGVDVVQIVVAEARGGRVVALAVLATREYLAGRAEDIQRIIDSFALVEA